MTSSPRTVLIDATNLVTGGAVQVAVSLLSELFHLLRDPVVVEKYPWLESVEVRLSPAVERSLSEEVVRGLRPRVELNRPWKLSRWLPRAAHHDVVLYVFGPDYARSPARRRVLGYADVRSVYGTPPGEPASYKGRLWWAARGVISRWRVRTADAVIVEADAFRERLIQRGVAADRISVIPNTINGLFVETPATTPVLTHAEGAPYRLLYVTRPYPHKNLPFLVDLAEAMDILGGPRLEFVLTMERKDVSELPEEFLARCHFTGEVTVQQLPALYASCNATIFPSLLESFSAMPLESMACGRVVFASDRPFVRDTAGEIPIYFDPLDPFAAAQVISRAIGDEASMRERALAGTKFVRRHASARDRALGYLAVVDSQLESP